MADRGKPTKGQRANTHKSNRVKGAINPSAKRKTNKKRE